jgi:7-keto-8-aminopelargonate synthetase-like enzyme
VGASTGPVIPVRLAGESEVLRAYTLLLRHGVYTNAVVPPASTVHQLRLACTDAHTRPVLDAALAVFDRLRAEILPAPRAAA